MTDQTADGLPRDAFLDALAFTRCTVRNDPAGRGAVARACDPVAMVDALTHLYLGLIMMNVGPETARVDAYLDFIRRNVDRIVDEDGDE